MWERHSEVCSMTCSSLSKLSGWLTVEVANNGSAGMASPSELHGEDGMVAGVRQGQMGLNESTDPQNLLGGVYGSTPQWDFNGGVVSQPVRSRLDEDDCIGGP